MSDHDRNHNHRHDYQDDPIRLAFRRLDRDVRGAVRPADGLDRVGRRRWARLVLLPAAAFAVVVVAVAAGALLLRDAETPPVATSLPAPDTTLPSTPDTGPEDTLPPPPQFGVTPTTVQEHDLLLAGPDGVFVDQGSGPVQITSAPAVAAAGDRRGGVVYEQAPTALGPGDIWHLPGGADAPRLVVPGARLQDVTLIDGAPWVVYTRERVSPEEEVSVVTAVHLYGLDTGADRAVWQSEGYEGGLARVSHHDGVYLITEAAEGFEWFRFVDAEGNDLDLANPRPEDAGDLRTQGAVLDPGGTRLAWVEGPEPSSGRPGPVQLVVWDRELGQEQLRLDLPDGNYEFVRIDFDGARVVVGRLDADRVALEPVIVDLAGPTVALGPRAGSPSLVGALAAPATPAAEAIGVPDGGLELGVLVNDGFGVQWVPYAGPGSGGAPVPVWRYPEAQASPGSGEAAFADGDGGAVVTEAGSLYHLPPGTAQGDARRVGDLAGWLHGVAEIDGATRAFSTSRSEAGSDLAMVDLATGQETVIGRVASPAEHVTNVSFDGERFWVALQEGPCSRTVTVDLDGGVAPAPAIPASPCDGGDEPIYAQARVSPDGLAVAWLEGTVLAVDPELAGDVEYERPLELVVMFVPTENEFARIPVGTDIQTVVDIHDFDGQRVLVSRQAFEPAIAPTAVFAVDLACGDCHQRVDTAGARVGLTGEAVLPLRGVASSYAPLTGCSVDGAGLFAPDQELPAPVAAMRSAILEAAAACDFDALDDLAVPGDYFHNFDTGAAGDILAAEQAGYPEVRLIAQVLAQPFGVVDVDGAPLYVWPQVATYESWDQVTVEEQNELSRIYDFPDQRVFAEFGGYLGLRVGITADGDWTFVATGD